MMIEVKVCDNCNHKNSVTATECEVCGYDLTFVFPISVDDTEDEEKSDQDTVAKSSAYSITSHDDSGRGWEIVSCNDENRSFILKSETSVGRDCDVLSDIFNSSNYTSRIHAKLRIFESALQVMDASTNGTFVDEKRIPKMEWVNVPEGSTVKFADVSFFVRRNNSAD